MLSRPSTYRPQVVYGPSQVGPRGLQDLVPSMPNKSRLRPIAGIIARIQPRDTVASVPLKSTGIGAASPFIAGGLLGCIAFTIAATIVLALIPTYLTTKTINGTCATTCVDGCTQQCLRTNAKCNSIPKSIRVFTADVSYPYISQSATGAPTGFDVDLMNSITSITGLSFTYEFQQFSQLIASVQNNTNTISISAQIDTSAREQSVNFAEYIRTATGFIVKSTYNQTINGLSDLCGKIVAVLTGSVQITDVMNQNAQCGGNNITIQTQPTVTEIVAAVQSGSANVGLSPEPVLISFASQSNGQLIVVGQAYNFQTIGISCNKENQALCCLLVNAINYLIKRGTYEQLLNKYSFTYQEDGICPSTVNLNQTCLSSCMPTDSFCQNKLGRTMV